MQNRARVFRYIAATTSAAALLGAGACGGDKITSPAASVASVQILANPTNPRVGETTTLGATPLNSGGVAVQGVSCTMVSGNTAVLLLTPDGGGWRGLGVTFGTAVVTATCGSKQNTVTITVRPPLVTLTVTKVGAGNGSVFINPAGGTYDAGTSVVITATALTGSTFGGWGGACSASGTASTCSLTLGSSQSVTATFTLGETFAGTPIPNTAMGNVSAGVGCGYAISTSGTLTALVLSSGGVLSGTASGTANVGIVVTYTPPNTTCTANPFSTALTGAVSGTDANVSIVAADANDMRKFTFAGTRSGNTLTGSLTILTTVSDGVTLYPLTKVITPYTMTKQ